MKFPKKYPDWTDCANDTLRFFEDQQDPEGALTRRLAEAVQEATREPKQPWRTRFTKAFHRTSQ